MSTAIAFRRTNVLYGFFVGFIGKNIEKKYHAINFLTKKFYILAIAKL